MKSPFSQAALPMIAAGYSPIPMCGKRPLQKNWQRAARDTLSAQEIASLSLPQAPSS